MTGPSNKNGKPTVIGLYGIQGTGKTTLVKKIKHHLDDIFLIFEGSKSIAEIMPIEAFKNQDDQEKHVIRCECISRIQKKCETEEKIGIVDGHASFFSKEDKKSFPVYTDKDLEVYTHIIYLCPDISTIFERRKNDLRRHREHLSTECLQQWQTEELRLLRKICRENGILIKAVKSPEPLQEVLTLVRDFAEHNEAVNLERAKKMLDEALCDSVETVFVFDGDKTLAPMDASEMFWAETPAGVSPVSEALSISGPTQVEYSYVAFRQVSLLYEEAAEDIDYEKACRETAKRVNMHPELQKLIKRASAQNHTGVIVITAGNRRIWELVLQSQGVAGIQVIAGNRLKDGYVVSKDVKTSLVQHLRKKNLFVVSFGDSPLDMGLLKEANNSIVVVGPEDVRSKKMKFELQKVLDNDNGCFSKIGQLLLGTETPLDCSPLPIINLDESLKVWFCRRVRVIIADKMPAKFLMTPTRDKRVSGKGLFNEYSRIGSYLATHHLPKIIGVEKYEIPHVQGEMTDGHKMADESTIIIAMMRAGLPLAMGLWEVMPRAMFLFHNRDVADCQDLFRILKDKSTIILADTVINSGKTIAECVKAIREKNKLAKIVVCAGVTQEDAVFDKNGRRAYLSMELGHLNVTIISLRISANKYRGSGDIDTGNRIFNTPHIL